MTSLRSATSTLLAPALLSLLALHCNRSPSEPPSTAPTPPGEVPRPPSEAPRPPGIEPSRAEPAAPASARDACSLLPEVAIRIFADIDDSTRVTQEPSNLAGLDSCRYRWRKRNAQQILAQNADRAQRNPQLLAAVVRRTGAESLESAEADVRLSLYPPRTGTPAMLQRGFEMAHAGEQVVQSLGDQAAFNGARRLLTVRRANRTLEVLAQVSDDEAASLALATRIARDVLSRLP